MTIEVRAPYGVGRKVDPDSGRQRIIRFIDACMQAGYFPSQTEIVEGVPGVSPKNASSIRWSYGRELGLVGGVRASIPD